MFESFCPQVFLIKQVSGVSDLEPDWWDPDLEPDWWDPDLEPDLWDPDLEPDWWDPDLEPDWWDPDPNPVWTKGVAGFTTHHIMKVKVDKIEF